MESATDWTIDRLAAYAGMTVRNVRAHAARGLLPPPRLQGRTGFYGAEHLARLELITQLQAEGFSLGAIQRLVEATPGPSSEQALTQYLEMLTPWRAESPADVRRDELASWVGHELPVAHVAALVADGLVEDLDETTVRVHAPSVVRSGAEAVRMGLPIEALLATRRQVLAQADEIARTFVDLFRTTVWQGFVDAGLPPDELAAVRAAVADLQPIAASTLMSAFRQSMPPVVAEFVREASAVLGEGPADPV